MEKKNYIIPTVEIIAIESDEIIATSTSDKLWLDGNCSDINTLFN